jgi:hypothetical protein
VRTRRGAGMPGLLRQPDLRIKVQRASAATGSL